MAATLSENCRSPNGAAAASSAKHKPVYPSLIEPDRTCQVAVHTVAAGRVPATRFAAVQLTEIAACFPALKVVAEAV